MKASNKWFIVCGISMVAPLSGSCEKRRHQQSEHYYFVAANINLLYWQDARTGFMNAATHMGLKADFVGRDSYDPQVELAPDVLITGKTGFWRKCALFLCGKSLALR